PVAPPTGLTTLSRNPGPDTRPEVTDQLTIGFKTPDSEQDNWLLLWRFRVPGIVVSSSAFPKNPTVQ
ncbi:MAG: hypothetical protein KDB01_20685, partial [Planctomycetaceae bacterium]|nr:hypothetical protein [Planctomycetaceae bacterium]